MNDDTMANYRGVMRQLISMLAEDGLVVDGDNLDWTVAHGLAGSLRTIYMMSGPKSGQVIAEADGGESRAFVEYPKESEDLAESFGAALGRLLQRAFDAQATESKVLPN